jgi:HrpA-like RNA helicase
MQPFEAGEMLRTPLDSVILTLKEMMGDDEKVSTVLGDCIEPPNLSTIERSYEVCRDTLVYFPMYLAD